VENFRNSPTTTDIRGSAPNGFLDVRRPGASRKKGKRGREDKKVKGGEEIRINRKSSLKAEERREEKRGERTEWWFGLVWFGCGKEERHRICLAAERDGGLTEEWTN
jgi:hypothetical protein